MTDRYPMAFMTYDECCSIGCEPYAVYGGKVYSFKDQGRIVAHGTQPYKLAHEQARATHLERVCAAAGARGC